MTAAVSTERQRRPSGGYLTKAKVRAGQLDENWKVDSACRNSDPDIWYPERRVDAWLGVQICSSCPVRLECLNYATVHGEEWGTWGGETEWSRDDRRRRHRGRTKPRPLTA